MANGEIKICTTCGGQIMPQDRLVVCNGCNKPYHTQCWSQTGRCQTYGCEGEPVYYQPAEVTEPPPAWQNSSAGGNVPNHLVWAILSTLFCCLPFGVVAIIYSSQVSGHLSSGDYNAALESSTKARNWSLAATICGVVVILISILAGVIPFIMAILGEL